jgi:hypothetical protein
VSNKELLSQAYTIVVQRLERDPSDVWAEKYVEWFSSALSKDAAGDTVPSFTIAAAQGVLLDERKS